MNIAIIGNGGREHSICHNLSKSKKINKLYCIPGNAGTNNIAKNINIDQDNFQKILEFLKLKSISTVIVGPEKPLVNGIVDFLEKNKIKVFGPNKKAAQLEGSKIFTKKLCKKNKIPTANYGIFYNEKSTINFIKNCKFPIVIKADGLASGKGVYICNTKKESTTAIKEIFQGKFGITNKLLVEEFLEGEEMSFFIICDGKSFKKFGTAQDHKRVYPDDKGPNTGGMGAYSPSRLENSLLEKKIINKIIKPTLYGLKKMGITYKGFLYAGLMIVKNEPFLIEYNVRMGDPECQTILPLLKNNFYNLIDSCLKRKLSSTNLRWENKKSLSIVLCSKGYPKKFKKNLLIKNLKKIQLKTNQYIFHAGTKLIKNKILSNGGRVLNFVVKSKNFENSRNQAIQLLNQLNWKNGYFRKDIGFKVID
ncbi:phosphoribosylamine--glycine ligase [Candidatus Pelagibacter sp.]|jgi:phosphoribosylamine--glycine ligase|nr:phosphoribosylamine--glycine ligase [Candidatus Pelagibacter sp.]